MANIDTTAIEGFDGMTDAQKVDALLKLNIPDKVDMSAFVPKAQADKFASEAAEYKRKYTERMTEDEKAKAESEAAAKKLQESYDALLRKSTVAETTAKYMAMGYSAELAKSTAEAMYDGDMEKVIANQTIFNTENEKTLRAKIISEDPKPAGAGNNGKSDDVAYAERLGKQRAESAKKSNEGLKHYF